MHTLFAFIVLLAMAIPATTPAATEPASPSEPYRVRPYDRRAATLLFEAQQRSATIRGLVRAVETSDVIVYVQMEAALLKRDVDGMVTWLTATKYARYVRISLNPQLSTTMAIAVLGHELQHVREIASEPSVVSSRSLESLYRKIGINTRAQSSHWDTEAARIAGEEVRKELSLALRSAEFAVPSAVPSAKY